MRRSEFMMGGLNFNELTAAQIMEMEVIAAHVNTTWHDLARVMTERGIGDVLIIDKEKNLLGIVTEFDLLKPLMESKDVNDMTAENMMTREPISVTEETLVTEIIDIIEKKHLIRLPVVKDKKLVGIVARRDVILAHLNATEKPPSGF